MRSSAVYIPNPIRSFFFTDKAGIKYDSWGERIQIALRCFGNREKIEQKQVERSHNVCFEGFDRNWMPCMSFNIGEFFLVKVTLFENVILNDVM